MGGMQMLFKLSCSRAQQRAL